MIEMKTPAIDSDRMLSDLDRLNEYGQLESGGVERIAFSEADRDAREWLCSELGKLPVDLRTDTVGNSMALLPGRDPELAPIVIGSHTDTVPNGGRFDGALGVIAALACMRALAGREQGLNHPVEWVNFAAEEATTTAGTFGSRAMAGLLSEREISEAGMDGDEITASQRSPEDIAAFLELHIEQGQELEGSGTDIGVVENIAALRRYDLRFHGNRSHAGGAPMARRDDALVKAADFVLKANRLAADSGARATIGRLQVDNGAAAVVPGSVSATLDLRAATDEMLDNLEQSLGDPRIHRSLVARKPAAHSSPELIAAIEKACDDEGASHRRLTSFPGHDARSMAALAPIAMVFVPSRGGISHSPDEFTEPEQCALGARVLLRALCTVAHLEKDPLNPLPDV